jgi:hypothetical protein
VSGPPVTPGGQVTIADLFRVMSAIQADLGRALTKLEVIDSRNTGADRVHADHETRLRLLEQARYKLIGAATTVGIISGALSGWVTAILHH